MNKLFLLGLVLSSAAFAQTGNTGNSGARSSRGNLLRIPAYETSGTAAQTYFVDGTLGSDSSSCQGAGVGACATIQGAVNRVPKLLRDGVTVNVASGTYAGFVLSGFYADNGFQQTTGGLLIQGTLVNSTLATGTATGTASAGSTGSGTTFGTLTDGTQSWTVNDLAGRILTTVSPTNTQIIISSNTATVITVVGTWSAPTGATTYAIQDPGVIVNTCTSFPANGVQAATSVQGAGVQVLGNSLAYRSRAIAIQNLRIAPASCFGVQQMGGSSLYLFGSQIRPTSTTIAINQLGAQSGAPFLEIFDDDVTLNSATGTATAISIGGGIVSAGQLRIFNASAAGIGVTLGSTSTLAFGYNGARLLGPFDISGFVNGIIESTGRYDDTSNGLQGSHITCGSAAGVGVRVGSSSVNQAAGLTEFASVSALFTTCGTALQAIGPVSVDVLLASGSVGTTGFDARVGALITYSKANTTVTAGTNEINLDNGSVTAAFADVTAGSCVMTVAQSSRVCGR